MKCSSCQHCGWGYTSTLDSQGVYRFAYCQVDIVDPVVVDAEVERECPKYEKEGKVKK